MRKKGRGRENFGKKYIVLQHIFELSNMYYIIDSST